MRYQMPLPQQSEFSDADAETVKTAFFEQVDKGEDCWEWLGPTVSGRGYGRFVKWVNKQRVNTTAHRFAAAWLTETTVEPGNVVVQTCGNRTCVRPSHLKVCEDKAEAYSVMVDLGHTRGPALSKEEAQEVKWIVEHLGRIAERETVREEYGLSRKSKVAQRLGAAERTYGPIDPKRPTRPLDTFLSPRRRALARAKWLAQYTDFPYEKIAALYDEIPGPLKVSQLKNEHDSYSPDIPAIEPEWYKVGMEPPEETP